MLKHIVHRNVRSELNHPADRFGETSRSLLAFCERCSAWWPVLCLVAMMAACCLSGCRPESESNAKFNVEFNLTPSPPTTGTAEVVVTLTDTENQPLKGARVELEGNMNHAGMKPVFSELKEAGDGKYAGTLNFTMGGDWFVLVTGELQDGTQINEQVDVPGVKTQ